MIYLKNTFFLLVIALITLPSCSDTNESPSTKAIVQSGKWKITSFSDNGTDATSQFNGYEFVFSANGTVTASKSGSSVTGTWATGADESTNKISISFGLLKFPDLNHDWTFITKSYTVFSLEYLSSSNGGSTDRLVFEKI